MTFLDDLNQLLEAEVERQTERRFNELAGEARNLLAKAGKYRAAETQAVLVALEPCRESIRKQVRARLLQQAVNAVLDAGPPL